MNRPRRHRALVRIYIEQDPDDLLIFVVTQEPGDNAIPVIPTSKAHKLWLYASPRVEASKEHRPSSPGSNPPDTAG